MANTMRAPRAAQLDDAQRANAVLLHVQFFVGGLTPSGVRRRFVSALRIEIARAKVAGELDIPIAEELWRSLPSSDRRR